MTTRKLKCFLVGLWLIAAAPAVSAQDFFLKKGDVVVVMGDSITEQRLYSNYLEIWSQTRFPSYNLVFRNVGIGGDTSGGGNGRFKRDVLSHKPTVLTVDFGMNDGGYIWPGKKIKDKEISEKDVNARLANYLKGQQGIADQAKTASIRVAWITPQPVESNPGNEFERYNKTLEKFGDGVKDIAKKNDGLFADQFHPYWDVIKKARDAGEKGRITGGDAVHPGPSGQAVMAASILKALGFPRNVSTVELVLDPAGKDNKTTAVNCKVFNRNVADSIIFMRQDAALPYFPEQAKSILKWAPLLEDMNDYGLKVTGLKPGKYAIEIDGKKIVEHTEKELAAGVNLAAAALAAGPIADRVKEIVKAVEAKTNFYHGQIYSPLVLGRNIVPKNPDFKDVAKEDIAKRRMELIEERMKRMPEFDAAIRRALEPRAHRWIITPVK